MLLRRSKRRPKRETGLNKERFLLTKITRKRYLGDGNSKKWRKFTNDELEEAWKYKLSSKDVFACKRHLPNWPHWKLLPVLASSPLHMLLPVHQKVSGRKCKKINYQETKSDEENESGSEYQPSSEDSNSSLNVKQKKKILKKKEKITEKSMTEYEKKIQKNIEERLIFFKSLKIDEAKQDFLELIKKPKRVFRNVPLPPPREKSSRVLQREKALAEARKKAEEEEKKRKERLRKTALITKICKWHLKMRWK
ncbi:hypothetical protein X975_14039, partial [Stegodyphus mimosarum]